MNIFDNMKSLLAGDEDYEDYEEYDDYEDEEEPEEKTSTRKKLFSGKKTSDETEESEYSNDMKATSKYSSKKVVPIKAVGTRGLEVVVIKPESVDDASEITDTLLSGKAVVLNLEGIHVDIAQRVIDYSAGSCYAMRGNLQKITSYIFLVTPPNVDISGDIPDIVAGGLDISTFAGN